MQTALITGMSRGIGKALAEKFLSEGWKVFGTVKEGVADITNKNLSIFQLDLSVPESIARCANAISKTDVKIDVLINNAGALFDEDDTQVFVDKLRKTLEVNLIGTIDFTERVLPFVATSGHILNISSTAGSLGLAGTEHESASHFPYHYPCYKISKTALNMYTRTLAARLQGKGVTVSSVHPGWVRTQMGGENADISPEESAKGLFALAISRPKTGGFWFNGKELPW